MTVADCHKSKERGLPLEKSPCCIKRNATIKGPEQQFAQLPNDPEHLSNFTLRPTINSICSAFLGIRFSLSVL